MSLFTEIYIELYDVVPLYPWKYMIVIPIPKNEKTLKRGPSLISSYKLL